MRYDCDFVIQRDDGQIQIGEMRPIEASGLPQAVKWIEDRIFASPMVFNKATAVRLRRDGTVVWLKSLGRSKVTAVAELKSDEG